MAAKKSGPVTRVRVRLSDAVTHQTIKSWVILIRGATSEQNALVRARMKARQTAAYEPGDRIEAEIIGRKVANPSHSGLTAHDKAVVRRVARQILDDRDMGEESIEGDNVVLSSGYASVDVSDSGETIYVTRNRHTVRVKMHEGRKGPSRLANPSKKRARKAAPKRKRPATKRAKARKRSSR